MGRSLLGVVSALYGGGDIYVANAADAGGES